MSKVYIEQIDVFHDSFKIFKIFQSDRYSFFLDSGMDHNKLGKYSFIGSTPFLEIESKGSITTVRENNKSVVYKENPFNILKKYINSYKIENDSELPFVGGVVGYFAYDLCHHFENIPRTAKDDLELPDLIMGFYDGVIIFDHVNNKVFVAAAGFPDGTEQAARQRINQIKQRIKTRGIENLEYLDKSYSRNIPALISNFTREDYCRAIQKAKEYIRQGDIYQMNMTQRFSTKINRHPINIYERLRTVNPAPFASYMDYGELKVVGSSPERFLRVKDRVIETRPIKGTLPRGRNLEEDERNCEKLFNSVKDRAENLMIVDLLRNDIGRICEFGSVEVPELFTVEEYPTVLHLVSTITGILCKDTDLTDCIAATFPGGSITGAPKIRAMEIIDELEPTCRGLYTGSIGYVGFDGNMDINIVIRTIVIKGEHAYYQVGGGIVWDSDPEKEYQETLDKGFALEKTLLWGT